MIGSAVFVARVPDLLSLNITAQVLNALLLPLVAGWLIALASGTVLPAAERVRGAYRVALIIGVSIACGIGTSGRSTCCCEADQTRRATIGRHVNSRPR